MIQIFILKLYIFSHTETGRRFDSSKKQSLLPAHLEAVQPVHNQKESRKIDAKKSRSRVKVLSDLDAEFYYKNIEDMVISL